MGRRSRYAVGQDEEPRGHSAPARTRGAGAWGRCHAVLSWLQHLHYLKTEHQFLGRYSIEKLHAFHAYQTSVSWYRVLAVLCLTPVPTLLALVAMDAVPLSDPRQGARSNSVCFLRSLLSHAFMTSVCLLPMRQALRLDESGQYSLAKVALIGAVAALVLEAVWTSTAFLWRFPVPFRELLGVPLWVALVILLHRWLTPRAFTRKPRRTRVYLAVVTTQIVLFYGFIALSMVFARVSTLIQVGLMVAFPLGKIAIKRFVWKYARQLDDISTDVTVCMVEISGSLYQTVCLQFATSKIIAIVIVLADFAQALLEVRAYVATEYVVDGRSTLATAFAILQSSVFPGADERPSQVHYSSTASQHSVDNNGCNAAAAAAGVAAAVTRRHSSGGLGTSGSPVIKLRHRKSHGGSLFVQPKLITHRTSKRLLDLQRFGFDALDGPTVIARGRVVEYETTDQKEETVRDGDGSYDQEEETSKQDPQPPLAMFDMDMHLMDSETPTAAARDPQQVAVVADTQPQLQPRFASSGSHSSERLAAMSAVRGMARVATHTDFSKRLNPIQPRTVVQATTTTITIPTTAVVPPPPSHRLSQVQTKSATTTSGAIYDPTQLVRRPSMARSASPSSFRSRRLSSSSLAKVQPVCASLPPPMEPRVSTPEQEREQEQGQENPGSSRIASLASAGFHRSPTYEKRRRRTSTTRGSASAVTIDGVRIIRKDQARIVEQALQLLFSCEVLLFVEYMEVVVPVLYALCVGGGAHVLANGQYNLLTRPLTTVSLITTLFSSFTYALLELLSLLVLHCVVSRKYGISAVHLLAFVLESYSSTLQGKLVGAFIVIWNTATIHQGVDFTFRFDLDALLAPNSSSVSS